jgi:DNA-binding transcriptional ArsR family regulator
MAYNEILDALGDPTRRRIFEALRAGPLSVTDLTKTQTVSRPAVSQHLRVMEEAGLVAAAAEGTRRLYGIRRGAVEELRTYLDTFWSEVISAYSMEIQRKFGN